MLVNAAVYGAVVFSLFTVDYALGHGFLDMIQKVFCKMMCFIKKTVKEESKFVQTVPDVPISFPVLIAEILLLSLTVAFLNKYKQLRHKDRIDDLLKESKEALKQTNEFLEKWRLRRVPTEYTYLDEEPQDIKPMKLEVPILHMAIIDTLGTTRSQPERGDAGDTINIQDSTLLSMTSLLGDDLDTASETLLGDNLSEDTTNIEFRNRYLWDVVEEDANTLED